MNENENLKQDTERIVQDYALSVLFVEQHGKIRKVYTDKGVFALKLIPPKHGIDFIRNVQFLYQRGYNRIVPIYPTNDGRYAILHNGSLYYLMPWLSNDENGERNERHKQMFRELARMHTLSSREMAVDEEHRQEHYQTTLEEWKKQAEFLEEYVGSCERKWYMSPFEMIFASAYADISQALSYSTKKFEEWYEKTKDKEKVRTVMTHGKLSLKHFIYDDRGYGYFINLENSRKAPAHFDLLPFVVKSSKTYPVKNDDCVDWIYNYFKYFPLKEDELLLFQSYLAYPGPCLDIVKNYFEKKGSLKEMDYLKQLQRQYWQLKNTEYVVMKMEEIEAQKKAAAAQQAQEQS
ncbi:spore coat protein YsxE [Bacillus sp. MUM 13]|uniref:spore coat protein YsxE n=1 Tax=Bacillus sp. MUM 13 TaxID=1678001 RepID=UPI0009F61762|nr:spore coat protein YsxE [Bacillus sp. MUM 13]